MLQGIASMLQSILLCLLLLLSYFLLTLLNFILQIFLIQVVLTSRIQQFNLLVFVVLLYLNLIFGAIFVLNCQHNYFLDRVMLIFLPHCHRDSFTFSLNCLLLDSLLIFTNILLVYLCMTFGNPNN